MADETKIRVHTGAGGLGGSLWLMGWLFTIGYLHLPVGKAILGIVLWPYYVGVVLHH